MKSTKFSASSLMQSAQLASSLFESKVVDESAETIGEISRMKSTAYKTIADQVRKLVADGKLEQVWKSSGKKLVPAYRIKK